MSAYKKLNKQDAYISTYTAHKSWQVTGNRFDSSGINVIPSVAGFYLSSLEQLYYPTKVSGSVAKHSHDYHTQTTLYNSESRNSVAGAFAIALPRSIVGTHINPGDSFNFAVTGVQEILYVNGGYWVDDYVNDLYEVNEFGAIEIVDDGEGSLYVKGSNPVQHVGDIIYPHGMIIITNPIYSQLLYNTWGDFSQENTGEFSGGLGFELVENMVNPKLRKNLTLSWESSQPIFTHNYHCRVRDFELNYTYNPTSLSSSLTTTYDNTGEVYSISENTYKGDRKNNITGSTFQPYLTTVGLYNDANELVAVAKTGQPIQKTSNTDMTLIVKIDI